MLLSGVGVHVVRNVPFQLWRWVRSDMLLSAVGVDEVRHVILSAMGVDEVRQV